MSSPANINDGNDGNDVLVECDKVSLLFALSRLRQHLPDYIWQYNTIYCYCHYYDYISTNRQTLISDAWNQRFYRPSFCPSNNCTLVSISGSKYYMIQAFTLEDSGSELLRCLRDTRRINWNNDSFSLYCDIKHLPTFTCLAEKKIKHPTFNYQILVMHLSGEQIEQLNYDIYLTEDKFIAPLDSEKHSKLVDDFWRYKGNNTFEMIKQSIEINGGTGLFQHGNDEPICWITTDQRLAPGFLFTIEMERRKGYASLILAKELQRLWQKHLIGMYTLVDSNNRASFHLHLEMGFQQEFNLKSSESSEEFLGYLPDNVTEQLVRKKSEHNELLISTLEELSLHQEDIERIEYLHNWCRDLKILLLQSNLISKIENLYKLKRLEYLNLAINNIERIENLEKLESLNKLDLTLNFIGELTSIENLKDNYNLRILILTGNPCVDYPNYREYVIATLPQLDSLDGVEITRTDKLKAKPYLSEYRAIIVQKQAEYVIKRDEQKVRFLQQKEEMDAKLSSIEDEEERMRTFWNSSTEHCPEIRYEISKYHRRSQDKSKNEDAATNQPLRKEPRLFAPCGRPYNLNKPQLPFTLQDEPNEYNLRLGVYKYLDTSYIKVNVEVNYIRVTVKGKVFQIALNDEVKPSEAIVQRSEITGELLIKAPKLHVNDLLVIKSKNLTNAAAPNLRIKDNSKFKDTVDIRNICKENTTNEIPDLIDSD